MKKIKAMTMRPQTIFATKEEAEKKAKEVQKKMQAMFNKQYGGNVTISTRVINLNEEEK
tara:strand:+ start:313 stop:489 length:177 start_codon:yes stop_codon:yes gene_type:complete